MTNLEQEIQALCFYNLIVNSPILSGSMQAHIQLGYGNSGFQIVIDAPFYDMKEWEKNKRLVYTGANKNGITAYAKWVNDVGAFGRHNKSEHWVNRVLNDSCTVIANKIGATVINGLPL